MISKFSVMRSSDFPLTAASGGTCAQLAVTELVSDTGDERTGWWPDVMT